MIDKIENAEFLSRAEKKKLTALAKKGELRVLSRERSDDCFLFFLISGNDLQKTSSAFQIPIGILKATAAVHDWFSCLPELVTQKNINDVEIFLAKSTQTNYLLTAYLASKQHLKRQLSDKSPTMKPETALKILEKVESIPPDQNPTLNVTPLSPAERIKLIKGQS